MPKHPDYYNYTRLRLEEFFGIPLSLGDRMILRQIVSRCIEDRSKISTYGYDGFKIDSEATMRYLGTFQSMEMTNELMSAVGGDISRERVNKVRERAMFWE